MDITPVADGGTAIDPSDRETLRRHLERFAGTEKVTEADDGTLSAEFSQSTYVTVGPDGRIGSGMPLHAFDAPADTLRFDHDAGELHVEFGDGEATVSYTFRRP